MRNLEGLQLHKIGEVTPKKRVTRQEEQIKTLGTDIIWQIPESVIRKEQGKKNINKHITEARDKFLSNLPDSAAGKRTYNIDFDTVAYQAIAEMEDTPGYKEAKSELNNYTQFQLQTMLGERFNTGISKYISTIHNGMLFAEGMSEPMIQVLQRGKDFRRQNGSRDTEREAAEVNGFEQIQKVLCDAETPTGTKMLVISLPGKENSIYKKNFYDVFSKNLDKNGKPFIEVSRFSSALSKEEALQKVCEIDSEFAKDEAVDDTYFLAHPIKIDSEYEGLKTAEEIHDFLHKDHETMTEREFAFIIEVCTPAILGYIDILSRDPADIEMQELSFNAILNMADKANDRQKNRNTKQDSLSEISENKFDIYKAIRPMARADLITLGRLPVNQVDTGCGLSGGYAVGLGMQVGGAPYGVGYFGTESVNICKECGNSGSDNHYHCPKNLGGCNKKYADETHKIIRTKMCSCGFEFGC